MAYDLAVGDRQVDLATISGWLAFKQELADVGDELDKLIVAAEADAGKLSKQLEMLDLADLSLSTRSIVVNLLAALEGVDGLVYVTDGFTDDDIEEDWEMSDDGEGEL